MLVIKKTIEEWTLIFKDYALLKDKIGYAFYDLRFQKDILDFFWKHDIKDVNLGYLLMRKLQEYRSLDGYFQEFLALNEEYGVSNVAFILDDDRPEFHVYLAHSGYRLAYFPKDIFPRMTLDIKSGGIVNSMYSWPTYQFIIDEVYLDKHERTLYTSTFRFVSRTFPSKAEMNQPNIEEFRFDWFDMILNYLSLHPSQVHFSVDTLEEYRSSNQERMLLTDGDMFDVWGNIVFKEEAQYTDVTVKNACFVLESRVNDLTVKVQPEFLEKYKNRVLLEKDFKKLGFVERLCSMNGRDLMR